MDILKMLEEGVVLSDGGMIIEARWRGYDTPAMILEDPDALRQIHQDFFRAGSHVLQAQTWWTSRSQLERRRKPGDTPSGEGARLEEISRTAIRLAIEASGGEALVAGCLNQTAAGVLDGAVHIPARQRPGARAGVRGVGRAHFLDGGRRRRASHSGNVRPAGRSPAVPVALQENRRARDGADGLEQPDARRRHAGGVREGPG